MQKLKTFWVTRLAELRNITWPTQNKAVHSMILVLTIVVITGVLLGLLDFILKQGIFSLIAL